MNMIQTRGKRVIAEFTLKREIAQRACCGSTRQILYRYRQIAAVGALQAGSAYSGAHSANGIAALFIATGQDEANVAESHAGITYGQLLDNGDYYWSVTLPAVICATYGGGTGLPTQRECLEMLGCCRFGQSRQVRRDRRRRGAGRRRLADLGGAGRRLGHQPRGAGPQSLKGY